MFRLRGTTAISRYRRFVR